jgi:hypothetical protein
MKSLANTVATIIITFIVTLALNSIVYYLGQPSGELQTGPMMIVQQQNYVPVDVSNFKQEPLDGLIYAVPASTTIQQIISSNPISIEPVPDNAGSVVSKKIKLSGFGPNQVTRVLIPVNSQDEADLVAPFNNKQLNLNPQPVTGIYSPLSAAINSALTVSIVAAIIYGAFLLYQNRQLHEWTEEIEASRKKRQEEFDKVIEQNNDELKKAHEELRESVSKTEEDHRGIREQQNDLMKRIREQEREMEEFQLASRKQKILLLARLNDYSKELTFWRDTIRKILYQAKVGDGTAETVIRQVTDSLHTYSTMDSRATSEFDFKTIEIMASYLEANRKSTRKPKD